MLISTVFAVVVVPIALGLLAGLCLEWGCGGRVRGVVSLLVSLLVPTLVATGISAVLPLVGLWDAAVEGGFFGVGVVLAGHQAFDDPRNILLTGFSLILTLVLVEAGTRALLPPPPAYPVGGEGPYFLLANVLRTMGPDSPTFQHGAVPFLVERNAMQADLGGGTMAERPPSAMLTREIVCSIAYGKAYTGVIDVTPELEQVFPTARPPIVADARRVLHVGDSMVYGANVGRQQTFTVKLEALQPGVTHVNGGISGMAPDDYFVVLQQWVAREPFDLAVMYLFAGNDMVGMDSPHPCSDWQSILTYENGRAQKRFSEAPKSEPRMAVRWLFLNSPLPYLLRVSILAGSASAAYVGAAFDALVARAYAPDFEAPYQHLETILATARDELRAKHTAFVVVVLPAAGDMDIPDGPSDSLAKKTRAITQQLGIPQLDATDLLRQALARGETPVQDDRVHFTEEGHALMARWLHENLPRVPESASAVHP